MPFSEVKIDRSFVADLARSEEAQVIVRSVIDLAHGLGMQVCAEGVEDRGSAEVLRAWGCEWAQGFLFAPAMASAEFEALVRQGKPRVARTDDASAPAHASGYTDARRSPPSPVVRITT
jgi:EAL domain-containing protein (putative c-di-GMP-specific phosphodiesterase class I)